MKLEKTKFNMIIIIIYRGAVIWDFLYIIVNSNSSETTEKELRRFSKDINEFLFKAPMVAKKSDDFILFLEF